MYTLKLRLGAGKTIHLLSVHLSSCFKCKACINPWASDVKCKSLTGSPGEHFTVLAGWSEPGSVERSYLYKVMRVRPHVLQARLVDHSMHNDSRGSSLIIIVLSPVTNLDTKWRDIRIKTSWLFSIIPLRTHLVSVDPLWRCLVDW